MSLLDPFRIEAPASISFSGGRTSAYMLRRVLDAHGGALPDGVHVLFCNTGKERTETLDFVRDCAEAWSVRVRWLEYFNFAPFLVPRVEPWGIEFSPGDLQHSTREVTYETASRHGEPFEALIRARTFLPNVVTRFCTSEMKVRSMRRFLLSLGLDEWTSVIGLRADEPRRVAKMLAPEAEGDNVCPLARAGIGERDVLAYWRSAPFDLRLKPHEGNCDLCFLKGRAKLDRIIRERPDLAGWWIAQESASVGAPGDLRFRHDRPSYARMLAMIDERPMLPGFDLEDDGAIPCACTD